MNCLITDSWPPQVLHLFPSCHYALIGREHERERIATSKGLLIDYLHSENWAGD